MTTTPPRTGTAQGTRPAPDRATLLEILGRELPADRLVIDLDVLHGLSSDQAEWAAIGAAAAAVRPRSEQEVRTVVSVAADLGTPIVPRGAGTGLSGGANAVNGCVLLDLSRMDAVLDIDADNLTCVVQPGVVNNDLKAAVAEQGLWYPPDPASSPWSTIGGNVATNAGGLCCVKYGVTGDYVLGLEVVTGTGEVVRLGRRTAKGVAGYDLCSLLVGSEGTLGIVTEVTVRLRPGRPAERTVAGYFDSAADAGRAVAAPDSPLRAPCGTTGTW